VMVPVPEELEAQVRHYLTMRMSTAALASWSEDAVAALYEQLDAGARVVVTTVARAVVHDEPITVATAATAAGTTTREILGIVLELVQRFRPLGGPVFPVMLLDPPEGADDDQRPLVMPRDGAQIVLAAAERT
jgi:hypothetical protein